MRRELSKKVKVRNEGGAPCSARQKTKSLKIGNHQNGFLLPLTRSLQNTEQIVPTNFNNRSKS